MPTAQRTPRTRFPLRCPQGEDKRIRDLKCESCALGVQANDQALRGMFFTESALLNRSHPLGPGTSSRTCYALLDLLRPLAGLSFRLGVAAGLASVTVVDDDDFQALRTADTSHESHTPSRQSPPAIFLIS